MRKLNLEAQSQNSSLCGLCRSFAYRSSAHGVQRIASSQDNARRFMWSVVFLFAIAGCGFHSVYLILTYLSYPRMTITEEIHADHIDFPALTVCNLNPLKKSSIREHLLEISPSVSEYYNQDRFEDEEEIEERGICFRSENEFLKKSRTMDLSDVWMSVIATKDSLMKCGHQAQDLITQCTYNARNCFNDSSTIILLDQYPSPRYGLCHTIVVDKEPLRKVKKTGLSLGLRLTLNIERDDYLDLVSPEFGARLLVHPKGTYPTLQGGGVVLQPGTKTYVGVRMRKIERLPAPYRGCYDNFQNSQLIHFLRKQGQASFALIHNVYTYEYCQTLCRDIHLLKNCGCVEEVTPVNNKFCDPCNTTQARCRTRFYRSFTRANVDHDCQKFCLPACTDVRYDLTVSRSEWPNVRHQNYVLKRWPNLKQSLTVFLSNKTVKNGSDELDVENMRKNFLRVHVYIQEMNYLSVRDIPAYTLPQLFADLGGCLGLYIGVSAITIVEVLEHMASVMAFLYKNRKEYFPKSNSVKKSEVKKRRINFRLSERSQVQRSKAKDTKRGNR